MVIRPDVLSIEVEFPKGDKLVWTEPLGRLAMPIDGPLRIGGSSQALLVKAREQGLTHEIAHCGGLLRRLEGAAFVRFDTKAAQMKLGQKKQAERVIP